ncbi:hypothetical protein IE81DRAFT_107669 [Ceraceosorus guamensis]|uniref:Uncharacterized protein n=1 Tax=Ceraceosorus guamensis TaxID=1522189 RepID=A0A316W5P8_9BASI|nr:hypothetical protein IE81DRAFT_107669 [Ceraceosorus guamensis]PWN42975.1 hypothetical protein IE81DRAFT_107669 [Ceraceosorus guamensis]
MARERKATTTCRSAHAVQAFLLLSSYRGSSQIRRKTTRHSIYTKRAQYMRPSSLSRRAATNKAVGIESWLSLKGLLGRLMHSDWRYTK